MHSFFLFAVLGLGTGAIYGLVALGLVEVYIGTGVLNFAQAGLVLFGGYAYYQFVGRLGLSPWLGVVLAVATGALLGVVLQALVMHPMRRSPALLRVIATMGVLAVIQSAIVLRYGVNSLSMRSALPVAPVSVFGLRVSETNLILLGLMLVVAAALWSMGRFTHFGRVMAAGAENPEATAALGYSPSRMSAYSWALGSGLAALAGALFGPVYGITPTSLTLLLVPALAASFLGAFRSFPITVAGALFIGVSQSLIAHYSNSNQGLMDAVPFGLIILVLAITGRGLPLRSYVGERLARVGTGVVRPRVLVPVVAAAACLMLLLGDKWVTALTLTVGAAFVCLSVVVVTGYAGQLSLAQYVIGGSAAIIAARLEGLHGWPFIAAFPVAVLAAGLVGLAVGLPSLRTRGVTLAIATLGLATVLYDAVLTSGFSGGASGIFLRPPSIGGFSLDPYLHPSRYGIFVLVCFVIVGVCVASMRRGAAGRRMLAVKSNERGAAALGVSVYVAKLYGFVMGAVVAGIGGVLLTFLAPAVQGSQFDVGSSITFVLATVVGGVGSVAGALFGALLIPAGISTQIFQSLVHIDAWLPLISGLLLVITLRLAPDGVAEMNRQALLRLQRLIMPGARSRSESPLRPAPATRLENGEARVEKDTGPIPALGATSRPKPAGPLLTVSSVRVVFGGTVAVDDVSLQVAEGEVHGLIGPNGAGKTTLVDVITGFIVPTRGQVVLEDVEVTRWSPQRRARAGLIRSFQSLELFEDLSIRENLAIASDEGQARRYLVDLVRPGRSADLSPTGWAAVEYFGLSGSLDLRPSSLSYGVRREVAIARALAGRPKVLLLDEPAAGMDPSEIEEMDGIVRHVAKDWRVGVILVEHNMELMFKVADSVTVLAQGQTLFQGAPSTAWHDPKVREAYLGQTKGSVGEETALQAERL